MPIIKSRADWGARPPEGQRNLVASEVDGIAVHYNGPPVGSGAYRGDPASVASYLRNTQAYHMDVRGWSDIAYQMAVDNAGTIWTLRGLLTRSGANGDADVNSRFGAVLGVLGDGQTPTAAMLSSIRYVVALFQSKYPNGHRIVGHKDIRVGGTSCPGSLYQYVTNGTFNPALEDEMTPEDREWLEGRLKAYTLAANNYVRQYTGPLFEQLAADIDQVDEEAMRTLLNTDLGAAGGGDLVGVQLQTGIAEQAASQVLAIVQPELQQQRAVLDQILAKLASPGNP